MMAHAIASHEARMWHGDLPDSAERIGDEAAIAI